MSYDVSKIGVGGVLRLPGGVLLTKAAAVVVMRLSVDIEITKLDVVAVLRQPTGFTLALDPGTYNLAGTAVIPKAGRALEASSELVVNGRFPLDTSGWTVDGADTTFTSVGGIGILALGPSASSGYAYQAVAVVPGQEYTLSAFLKPKNAYTLTAAAGSYAMAGTPVDLSVDEASGSGFSGDSVVGVQYAEWTISLDGYIYKRTNAGAAVQAGPWIIPQVGTNRYEVMATKVSGDTPLGMLNTWLPIGQTWGFEAVSTDHECVLLIQVRVKTTLEAISSGDVSIFAAGLA